MNQSAIKANSTWFICIVIALVFTNSICNAQTVNLKPAPSDIVINGSDKEWGDNLPYSGDKAHISYTLANDKDNLYLILKTKDTLLQGSILGAGITFSIDINGKKSITFPVNGPEDKGGYLYLNPVQVQIKAALSKYKKINAGGFVAIADEQLSTSNLYGIKIVMGYDAAGYLIYEEAIPLNLFQADDPDGKEWAFTVKINELKKAHTAYLYETNVVVGHMPTNAELLQNEKWALHTIDVINAGGGWANMGDGKSNRISIIRKGHDPGYQQITIVKYTPLSPSVEFGGKFVLAKVP